MLANSVTRGDHGASHTKTRTAIGEEDGRPIYLFSTDSPLRKTTGDLEAMALYAGIGAGRISTVMSAEARVRAIAAEASSLVASDRGNTPAQSEFASPACSAHELDERYMGFATLPELLAALNELLEVERAGVRISLRSEREASDGLKALVRSLLLHEARWCGVLTQAIQRLRGAPSRKTSFRYDEAIAVSDLTLRLACLRQCECWAVQKLENLVPAVRDEALRADLAAMLVSHRDTAGKLMTYSAKPSDAGDES